MTRAELIAEFTELHGRAPGEEDFDLAGIPVTAAEVEEVRVDKLLMERIATMTVLSEKVDAIRARKRPAALDRLDRYLATLES